MSISSLSIPIMGLKIKYVPELSYKEGKTHAARILYVESKDMWEMIDPTQKQSGMMLFFNQPSSDDTKYIEVTHVARSGTAVFGQPTSE